MKETKSRLDEDDIRFFRTLFYHALNKDIRHLFQRMWVETGSRVKVEHISNVFNDYP